MSQSGGNFLDALLLGVKNVQGAGTPAPPEPTINFIGATVVDDPSNKRTNVTVSTNVNAVSGTGFWHSTSGTLDSAARLVNLSTDTTGILPLNDLAQGGAPTGAVLSWTGTQWAGTTTIATGSVSAGVAGQTLITNGGPTAAWSSAVTVDPTAYSGVSVAQVAGGTQSGVVLGANLATAGHFRTPSGFLWMARNPGNTVNNTVIQDDAANNLGIGNSYSSVTIGSASSVNVLANSTIAIESGADSYLDETTLHLRNASHTEYITITPAAVAAIQFNATNATSGQISWTGAAAAGGGGLSIQGQAAGGSNDGGQVVLIGGTHGAGSVDGSVKINTPLNPGFLSFTPVNGTQTLNNNQSDANIMLLNAGATNPVTINILRRISDTSCIWVRNNTSQTVTLAYITGGSVALTTATSALICSDGSNLQAILKGT